MTHGFTHGLEDFESAAALDCNATTYRYLLQKERFRILTKLGIAIVAEKGLNGGFSLK